MFLAGQDNIGTHTKISKSNNFLLQYFIYCVFVKKNAKFIMKTNVGYIDGICKCVYVYVV